MTTAQQITQNFIDWRARYQDRDTRHYIMKEVLKGNIDVIDPDEEEIEMRSPNLVQVALEDTAEAASLIPTVRVRPTKTGPQAKDRATAMERIGTQILKQNEIELLIPKTVMDLGWSGLACYTVTPDMDEGRVRIELRNPEQVYPEPGFRPGDKTRRVVLARDVFWSQLPQMFQSKLWYEVEQLNDAGHEIDLNGNVRISLIEYYDEDEIVVLAVVEGAKLSYGADGRANPAYIPVELSRVTHNLGVCLAIVDGRITHDGEFRGQFDQTVGMLAAHVRLTGMMLDYADQSVYSDVWVRDLIGEMPYGGGAFIELGPNGAIGRVPPAVTSLNVTQDLEALVDGIHVGGRWPKSRPGEIDQSIASAKFLETSAGLMNTAIRTYHLILSRMLEKALRTAFLVESEVIGLTADKRMASGVYRNHEFAFEYDSKTIDMTAEVSVEYGLGLGRDPSNSAVLHIQYAKEKFISKTFVRENIDGDIDAALEEARIDLEDLRAMALGKLMQGLEMGTIPDKALVEIAKAREMGDTIFELYEKYIVEPAEEAAAQQIPTGLGGALAPGALPGAPVGPAGPGGGPIGALPAPPQPPGGLDLMARMNVPAGPGGTLGTQAMTPGG